MAESVNMVIVFGGNMVGQCFALMLYGVLGAQCYSYFLNQNFKKDRYILKYLVMIVWLLESLHTACVIHYLYENTILNFGELLKDAVDAPWSVSLGFLVNMLIVGFVQGYYIYRIWILSKKSYLRITMLSTTCFLRIGFGLATAALAFKLHSLLAFQTMMGPRITVICGLSFAALNDALIALTLIYLLYHQRTGFASSDHVIHMLAAFVVNTGALTMAVSAVTLITYLTLKNNSVFVGFAFIAAKLYSNSFLGTLNARDPLRKKAAPNAYSSGDFSDIHISSIPRGLRAETHVNLDQESQGDSIKVNDTVISVYSAKGESEITSPC